MSERGKGELGIQSKSWIERKAEEARAFQKTGEKLARVAAVATAMTGFTSDTPNHQRAFSHVEIPALHIESNPVFDKPEFFKKYPGGEFTDAQRKARTKTLPNGEMIFEDIGLTFYLVQKGDTISEIKQKLEKYPEYAYLKDQRVKIQSFNIPAKELQPDMWLPIPMKNEDRHLTDEAFEAYAELGIKNLNDNEGPYHEAVEKILGKVSPVELTASLEAVAKQESGGEPIGSFEFHRWEGHGDHHAFSFSAFHVLMEGPGLKARRNLDLTEGQTYHPTNASELFIGFLVEKCRESRKDPSSFFPFDKSNNAEKFAAFYNGSNWQHTNPNYVTDLLSNYSDALADMNKEL